MKSYGNSLESRDTYVEFDNDTKYFKWAGSTNGLAMYMRNSQGFENHLRVSYYILPRLITLGNTVQAIYPSMEKRTL